MEVKNMSINVNIAVGVGTKFAIVSSESVKHIVLQNTHTIVEVDGVAVDRGIFFNMLVVLDDGATGEVQAGHHHILVGHLVSVSLRQKLEGIGRMAVANNQNLKHVCFLRCFSRLGHGRGCLRCGLYRVGILCAAGQYRQQETDAQNKAKHPFKCHWGCLL